MTLAQALLIFTTRLMTQTCQTDPATKQCMPYDHQVMEDTVEAVAQVTSDFSEAETLVKIARWESGGFRKDVANCKVKGDHGAALGLFQVHPYLEGDAEQLCSKDYRDQATVALQRVRDSVNICKMHGYQGSDLLTIYTCGHCCARNPHAWLRWGDGKTVMAMVYTETTQPIQKKSDSNGQQEAER